MADEIGDLKFLSLLVDAGNLSEAARRLDSSPPAMSRRLAAMETRLGVRLFNRSSRRFILTHEGSVLHQRARQILTAVGEAEAEVSSSGGVPRGVVRVGAPMQIGRRLIAPLVGRFTEHYPEVSVQLTLSGARLNVIDDALDIAVRIGMPDDPAIVVRRLMTSRRVICATPDYLARHGPLETPDDLATHNCVLLMRGPRVYDRWTFHEEGQPRVVQVKGTLATTSGEVVHEWLLEGRGVAQKALWNVGGDLRDGRLIECLAPYTRDDVALYATFERQLYMPPRMRVFLDFMIEELQHEC